MSLTMTPKASQSILLATFFVREAHCGLDATGIQEVIRLGPLTPVRHAPPEVAGIVNLRGKIVTILDLGLRLGFTKARASGESRIFIIEDRAEYVGLLVDRVDEVVEVDRDKWQPPPANVARGQGAIYPGGLPNGRPSDHGAGPRPDPGGIGPRECDTQASEPMSIRVLVVDDTVVFRRIVSDALAALPGVEVVGTASNGKLALARIASLQPDMVTLDIEMPEMNGIEVLEAMGPAGLKAGVIMLSSLTVRGGEMTVRALELGAFDFITKPEGGTPSTNLTLLRERLMPIIRAYERRRDIRAMLAGGARRLVRTELPPERPAPAKTEPALVRRPRTGTPLILIGVSTGGPAALASLLPALPGDLGAPVIIVQHMPAMFTQPLAASLDRKCAIGVREAQDGAVAEANCAYLAPGGTQMKLMAGPRGEVVLRLADDPPENGCKTVGGLPLPLGSIAIPWPLVGRHSDGHG